MSLKPVSFLFVFLFALLGTSAAHAAATCPANLVPSTPTADFTINGDGTVTHLKTGLMWKQCAEGLSGANCNAGGALVTATLMNWSAALAAGATPFVGYNDWRLPSQKELRSVVETSCFEPSINEAAFPNTPFSHDFWSSTTYVLGPTNAWLVSSARGNNFYANKTASNHARLVRGGQLFDSFDARKKAQVIVFVTAPTLVVGGTGTVSATGGASLNPVIFSSLSAGVCTSSGSTVTGVSAGSCTIAANQAGNLQYNAAAQVTQSFNVDKANQTIHFGTAPTIVVGGTGVVFAFTSAGFAAIKDSSTPSVCTISGNTVTGGTVGTCTITGDHHGNANYYAAPQATQSFAIGKGSQTIVFGTAPTLAVAGTALVDATGGASGNPVTFNSTTTNICTLSGSTVTGVTVGTCILAANQVGSADYFAAPQVTQSFSVGKGNQTIVFGPAPTLGLNGLAEVSATGGASGNSVTFSSMTLGVCTITGSTVTGVTLGTCTIAADQLGDANYYPAPQVLQSLVVIDTTVRLNDTGLDKCWDGSALVTCSPTNSGNTALHPRQDARFGRDAAAAAGQLNKVGAGDKGFDFTRVCMSGEMAGQGSCPATPVQGTGTNQWACTRDNVTHRIWSLDSTIYNWLSATTTYPAAMNATNRCGYNTGWRLPTRRELFSIVHSGRSNPTIDTTYFPGTPIVSPPGMRSYYWSADSSYVAMTEAWIVDFEAGYTFDWAKTNYLYARLVRSGP